MELSKTLRNSFIGLWILTAIASIVGYANNAMWIINNADLVNLDPQTVIAILGVVIPPLGMVHGWVVMF